MFTGIIEEVGRIHSVKKGQHSQILTVEAEKIMENLHMGDSIAVNGICLTVTDFDSNHFTVDVMHETLKRSSLKNCKSGQKVNLERAMVADGCFGGHIVSGHVDGLGRIVKIEKDDNALWFSIKTTPNILRYIVEKGSVTMDGISLTVAKLTEYGFSVSVIPHTVAKTILKDKKVGDAINLETDLIGKYVEKFLKTMEEKKTSSNITMDFLCKNGF